MEEKKEIRAFILAKSKKNRANCVGGVDLDTGKLVRFVSSEYGDALTDEQMKSRGRTKIDGPIEDVICEPLSEVSVPIIGERPLKYQPENVLVDTSKPWRCHVHPKAVTFKGIVRYNYADRLRESFRSLSSRGPESLFGGSGPTLEKYYMDQLDYSLAVIEVSELEVRFTEYRADNGYGVILPTRRSYLASFVYNNVKYHSMRVTDPNYFYTGENAKYYEDESSYEEFTSKIQKIGKAYLVASVPNAPFEKDGRYYKFIAAIYPERIFG